MEHASIAFQIIIFLGLVNVWLIRRYRPSQWRGKGAKSLKEEFEAYGLPLWFMKAIGVLKLTLGALLVLGLWVPAVVKPAAFGLAILMVGAIAMHAKVNDPAGRSVPAIIMLLMSLVVAAA
ncbi:hypothetical protein FUAX_39640 (plasmid) [Fulvitalea axinellae]|uniref:DoxX family protein n=1 Tax=Fulvitalea axinellae TaxID=1182444 RepID=A0AAU9CU79_9BACT|nr:hypothetical protein FUAX_39640 [Fulvitalea axinellae]